MLAASASKGPASVTSGARDSRGVGGTGKPSSVSRGPVGRGGGGAGGAAIGAVATGGATIGSAVTGAWPASGAVAAGASGAGAGGAAGGGATGAEGWNWVWSPASGEGRNTVRLPPALEPPVSGSSAPPLIRVPFVTPPSSEGIYGPGSPASGAPVVMGEGRPERISHRAGRRCGEALFRTRSQDTPANPRAMLLSTAFANPKGRL